MNQSLRVSSGSQLQSAVTLRWHIPLTAAYILTHRALHSLPCLLPHRSAEAMVFLVASAVHTEFPKSSTPVSTCRLWVYDPLEGVIIFYHNSTLPAWCFLAWAVRRSKTRRPNINTVHILYLHNNPFHVSWLTKLQWRKAADKKMIKSQKKDKKKLQNLPWCKTVQDRLKVSDDSFWKMHLLLSIAAGVFFCYASK